MFQFILEVVLPESF